MTSFVYQYMVMTPMPKIITRICFFRQESVQYVLRVMQCCLKHVQTWTWIGLIHVLG